MATLCSPRDCPIPPCNRIPCDPCSTWLAHCQTRSLSRVDVVLCIQGCSEKTKELGIRSPGIRCLWGGPNYLGNGRLRVTFPREKRCGNSNPPEAVSPRVLGLDLLDGVGYTWRGAGEMTGVSESRRALMCASRIMVLFPTRMCLPSGRESGSPTPATANTRHSMHNCIVNPRIIQQKYNASHICKSQCLVATL